MRALESRTVTRGLAAVAGLALAGVLALYLLSPPPALGAHNARMDVSPVSVEPGGDITVEGLWGFPSTEVRLRFGGLDGEVIATLESDGTFGPQSVTIPDAEPGTYVLVADQDVPEDYLWGKNLPARAQVEVTGGAQQASADDAQAQQASAGSAVPRLAALARQQPPGAVLLVGLAVGVAIVSWLVAAFVSRLGRRTAG
jgi:hypothetical protein